MALMKPIGTPGESVLRRTSHATAGTSSYTKDEMFASTQRLAIVSSFPFMREAPF